MPYPLPPPEPPIALEVAPAPERRTDQEALLQGTGIAPPSDEAIRTTQFTLQTTAIAPSALPISLTPCCNASPQFSVRTVQTTAASLGTPLPVGFFLPQGDSADAVDAAIAPSITPQSDPPLPETARVAQSNALPSAPPTEANPPPLQDPLWNNGGVTSDGNRLPTTTPSGRPPILLDLTADSQEFDPERQVVTAEGDVVLRLGNGILRANRLWVNLFNRYVLAEGAVSLERGDQLIRGNRAEYNLLQGAGSLFEAQGELFLPTAGDDFANILPNDVAGDATRPISDRLRSEGPVRDVTSPGGLSLSTSNTTRLPGTQGGNIRRVRFEAARVDFDAEGWIAREVRLTNDPFSPPELELYSDSARLVRINENEDELQLENPRLVFDQAFALPLFISTLRFFRGEVDEDSLNPLPTGVGIDGRDRGGVYIERRFTVATVAPWRFTVTPQFYLERFIGNPDVAELSNYGAVFDLSGALSPSTFARATARISGFDLDNINNRLRANVRVQQSISTHILTAEYNYRSRLFNGSLGFQDIQNSFGAILTSPVIPLGDTGIDLSYQLSAQYVTAETDRFDLLSPTAINDFLSLGRFQGSIALSRRFRLWQGEPLPPTPEAGLRFTPSPVVPFIDLVLGGRGTYTYYTSEDTQENLTASVGLRGQLGRFSNTFFDSTQFNITYSKGFVGEGESPFLFDRDVDRNILSGGIIQQIYGPVRAGVQVSVNLDTGEFINTDYILEYSRRTYGLVVRFNPIQSTGFIGFRLSDFDWSGRAASFGGAEIRPVEGGIIR